MKVAEKFPRTLRICMQSTASRCGTRRTQQNRQTGTERNGRDDLALHCAVGHLETSSSFPRSCLGRLFTFRNTTATCQQLAKTKVKEAEAEAEAEAKRNKSKAKRTHLFQWLFDCCRLGFISKCNCNMSAISKNKSKRSRSRSRSRSKTKQKQSKTNAPLPVTLWLLPSRLPSRNATATCQQLAKTKVKEADRSKTKQKQNKTNASLPVPLWLLPSSRNATTTCQPWISKNK